MLLTMLANGLFSDDGKPVRLEDFLLDGFDERLHQVKPPVPDDEIANRLMVQFLHPSLTEGQS